MWQPSECSSVKNGAVLLLWCLWRERNDRSFEDRERMMVELKSFFNILYLWTFALDFPNVINFHVFLDLFSPSSSVSFLYTLSVLRLRVFVS
jgi:hypothetical protein